MEFLFVPVVVAIVFGWVFFTTREPKQEKEERLKRVILRTVGHALKKGNPTLSFFIGEYAEAICLEDVASRSDVKKVEHKLNLLLDYLNLEIQSGDRIVKKNKN